LPAERARARPAFFDTNACGAAPMSSASRHDIDGVLDGGPKQVAAAAIIVLAVT
jgi:hypothetical protein